MQKQNLPNATAVLILGILSILGCCFYIFPGIICGVIALRLYKKDIQLYQTSPELYQNYELLNTGRILSIIGITLSVLNLIFILYAISLVGVDVLFNQELMKERLNDLTRSY